MKRKQGINTIKLFNKFREYGFTGDANDRYVIEAIENQALTYPFIVNSELENLNEKILAYMVSRKEKDYQTFIKYLIGSRLIKPLNINLTIINIKVQTELKEMEEIVDGINNSTAHT